MEEELFRYFTVIECVVITLKIFQFEIFTRALPSSYLVTYMFVYAAEGIFNKKLFSIKLPQKCDRNESETMLWHALAIYLATLLSQEEFVEAITYFLEFNTR